MSTTSGSAASHLATREEIIAEFGILSQRSDEGKRLVYLDNGATTQRPDYVIEAVSDFYRTMNANPHRGIYTLAEKATEAYDSAHGTVARFINAGDAGEVVFTRNASESLNLIAYSWGAANLRPGDRIVITIAEHHSNLVPWQQVAARTGATLSYLYLDAHGDVTDEEVDRVIDEHTKLVAVTHVSNVLGTTPPIAHIVEAAHGKGALVVLDAAQSVPHLKVDVRALDVDFAAFSGHKMYSPFGIGVLYGRRELLESMPPFLTGGDMIEEVTEQGATWAELPSKYEAGTQNAGGAVGLAAAIEWIGSMGGVEHFGDLERETMDYLYHALSQMPHITIYGDADAAHRHGVVSFNVDDVHSHDIASILAADNVCIRAGHHCAQPLLHYLGISACARASIAVYNTHEDVDDLIESLSKTRGLLGYGN